MHIFEECLPGVMYRGTASPIAGLNFSQGAQPILHEPLVKQTFSILTVAGSNLSKGAEPIQYESLVKQTQWSSSPAHDI